MKTYSDSKWVSHVPSIDSAFTVNGTGWNAYKLSCDVLPLGYTAGAKCGEHILVAGGIEKNGFPTSDARILDSNFITSKVCPLPFRLFGHTMTQTPDGEIILGGGVKVAADGSLELSSEIFKYSPKHDKWESIARLPWRSARLVGEQVNGCIYFIAGDTATTHNPERSLAPAICRDSVQILNLATGRWSEGCPKPTPETGVTSAVHNGKIYVVSSVLPDGTINDIVEVYCPATDSWSNIPPMPTARTNVPCGFVGNKLYCVNGLGRGLKPLSLVEVFDLDTGKWTTQNSAPPAFHASAVVPLDNQKFVIVGGLQ
ncbi:Kelch repeat-containing protein [Aeromonas enterica]